jgi:redox-sensitive bicupin YhaK (pirin superfamily)
LVTYTGNSESTAPIRIHSDVNINAAVIPAGSGLVLPVERNRQAYLVNIDGESRVGNELLHRGDALEITEESPTLTAESEDAHLLVVEMAKA